MVRYNKNKLESEVTAGNGQLPRSNKRKKRPGLRERLRLKRKAARAKIAQMALTVPEPTVIEIDLSSGDENPGLVPTKVKPSTSYGGGTPDWRAGDPTCTQECCDDDDLRRKLNKIAIVEPKNEESPARRVVLEEANGFISADLWNRVVEGAKAFRQKTPDTDGPESNNGVWTLTKLEQKEDWLLKWPLVSHEILDTMVDTRPMFSTLEVHSAISIRLAAVTLVFKMERNIARLLFRAGQIHMDIARYIERFHFDGPSNSERYSDLTDERLLVMETTEEDRATLGLARESAEQEEKPPYTHYNPLNPEDNANQLWICPQKTRLLAWTLDWPASEEDLIEHFVPDEDDMRSIDSHALITIKAMKMRELIQKEDAKVLLLRLAFAHLKIVDYYHEYYRRVLKHKTEYPNNEYIPRRGYLW